MPDWVFNTDTMTFSTKDLEEQKKNRPAINLEIYETKRKREYWQVFSKYHYLNHDINVAARVWVCFANGQLAGFTSALPFPHPYKKNYWRLHRSVVLPDYQGVGIATTLRLRICQELFQEGKGIITTTSNRAMIASMKKTPQWKCVDISRKITKSRTFSARTQSGARITASFEYIGAKR